MNAKQPRFNLTGQKTLLKWMIKESDPRLSGDMNIVEFRTMLRELEKRK